MRRRIVEFSVSHPKRVIFFMLFITFLFGTQLPKIKTDTDPKHMLPATSPVRQYNDQVEEWFGLHADVMVLGIRNDEGIFNPGTLKRIEQVTEEILKIQGVIARDVIGFSTVDDVESSGDILEAHPLLSKIPETKEEIEAFKKHVLGNPLLVGRLISKDGKTTAVYIPIEKTANGKEIADQIKRIIIKEEGPEKFYLAGDPVVRDTFGVEMFKQMGFFSPVSGMVMFVVLFLMFRNRTLVFANMAVAMMSIIWSMGLFIGLGVPVHIMSSMSPVFLMAISTDTVHIFNEFYFRFKELGRKREALFETMNAVSTPVLYSDLTTAAGFASLAIGHIIPVRIFGLLVAFGTIVILLMSFTFVPAVMALMKEENLKKITFKEDIKTSRASAILFKIGELSLYKRKAVVLVGLFLLILSIFGIKQIKINNNMVTWFKKNSEVRIADQILNENLGGTSTLYLVTTSSKEDVMKEPEVLLYIESLQGYLEKQPLVGKTLSVADYVKRVNRVLHQDEAKYEVIPESREAIAQYMFLFSMAAKPRDLDNLVDYPYEKANIIVQLKTWDAVDTEKLIEDLKSYFAKHPLPGVELKPAGIAYFNMVWNHEVLIGMLEGFILSSILVLFLLILDYRSLKWGIISFIPLFFTIILIYGFTGFVGKDFDMPISVLSTLSLGMAIDFAIHFVSRFKQRLKETSNIEDALLWTIARPGKGIIRNAILFAVGFSPMIFAALTPYITVGFFMMAIMILSAVTTIIYLPALIYLFQRWLIKGTSHNQNKGFGGVGK